MDLAKLDTVNAAAAGAPMEVLHPGDGTVLRAEDGTPLTIWLIGSDSERVKKRQHLEINKRLKRNKRSMMTAQEMEEDGIALLAFCTVSWSGITLDGEQPPCTEENARMLYSRLPWLREQVDAFVGDRANFLKAS